MVIFLTTISILVGLVPIMFETDLQVKLLIPKALSTASGVAIATTLVTSILKILSMSGLLPKKLYLEMRKK